MRITRLPCSADNPAKKRGGSAETDEEKQQVILRCQTYSKASLANQSECYTQGAKEI